MSISDQVDNDIKDAMRAQQAARLSVLRLRTAASIRKQVKQRQDSVDSFEQGGRPELADKERTEITLLQTYLPQALSPGQIDQYIDEAIAETGASTKAQMGVLMKAVQAKVAGRADGKTLSQLVQKRLA